MNRVLFVLSFSVILILLDLYAFQAIRTATQGLGQSWRLGLHLTYWVVSGLMVAGLWVYNFVDPWWMGRTFRTMLMTAIFANLLAKLILVFFVLIDDLIRLGQWIWQRLNPSHTSTTEISTQNTISRSEFLARTGVIAATAPFLTMSWGIISGAHDYRIRKKKVFLPNLPKAFDGMRIAQISDIHSGSFWNKVAVQGGIDLLMAEKPDAVFFTGDLVNNKADEVKDYFPIFSRIKAPLGVYSVTGNHDYGDYVDWQSPEAKRRNFADLKQAHKEMGWDLLMNENRALRVDGEQIGVLGIENWGKGRFPKYGQLDLAKKGSEEYPVKLLLSHDPSHWSMQVLKDHPDIDVAFAGHTHGMQFGVEIPGFRWSPVQYVYEHWAGLYEEQGQYLYVNRGYGYLAYPGRIGIPPEITIIELKCA